MLRLLTCLFLCVAALPQDRPRPYPIRPSPEWQRAVDQGTRSAEGLPGPDYWRHDIAYRLRAELDPSTARVSGHAELTLQNGSPRSLRDLVVHLRQNLHRDTAMRNRWVAITGGMEIDDLSLDGSPLPRSGWRVNGTLLRVDLPDALEPGASTTLALDFAFTVPPAGRAPRMGHEGEHLFYLGFWYPQFAVHDDLLGWTAEQYMGSSEFYMPYGDYELEFTAPCGYLVQATGTLLNPEEVLTATQRDRLEMAQQDHGVVHVVDRDESEQDGLTASSPSGKLVWRFRAEDVRDCAVATSDRWLWDSTHAVVPGADGERRCMIHAFYRPDARAWRRAAQYAQHAIEFGSRELMPYPWPHMSAIEGIIGGGMEYPMMTLIGDAGVPFLQEMVIAHELMHMWFPMQVGSNEKAHPWQDEGLTDFVTDFASGEFWKRDDPSALAIAEFVAMTRMGADREPLMVHGDHYTTEMGYGFASYIKAKAMLHQLVGMFSREQVLAALRDYARAWDRRHPTPYDFFRCMNRSLGRDLDWYWRTWCYENWTLDHEIGEVTEGAAGTVAEVLDLGDAPHPALVRATYADGSTEERTVPVEHWLQGNRRAEVRFGKDVDEVRIDPDGRTLDVNPRNNIWRR